jgi:hypothetical protein
MRAILLRAIEALPLAAFLMYIAVVKPQAPIEWYTPYYAAAALAIAAVLLVMRLGAVLNRIYLGIALYFVSGSVALLVHWAWLNIVYGRLEGTGMLLWVCAVGLAFTLFSRRGYVGVDAPAATVRFWSWLLFAITLGATVMSLTFMGNPLLSSFLPFVALFTVQGVIKARLHLRAAS